LTKAPITYYGENIASSTNVAVKTGICLQKTEARPMLITLYLYKYQFKVD
jgi:hypothetical protein